MDVRGKIINSIGYSVMIAVIIHIVVYAHARMCVRTIEREEIQQNDINYTSEYPSTYPFLLMYAIA